jgi:hypothetical protein
MPAPRGCYGYRDTEDDHRVMGRDSASFPLRTKPGQERACDEQRACEEQLNSFGEASGGETPPISKGR